MDDPTYEYLLVDRDREKHIARVTFNRPDKLNAFNLPMRREFIAVLDELEWDDAIKVIVFRGAGKDFSTGADLDEVGRHYGMEDPKEGEKARRPSLRTVLKNDRRSSDFHTRIFNCTKATIAQVQGHCIGGGFDIFLACDLAVAADDAKFGHPGVLIAAPFYDLSTVLWMYKLGMTLTKELALTGRMLTAHEAQDWHILNRVTTLEALEDTTTELAEQVAKISADGIVLGKTHISMLYNILGMSAGYNYAWIGHTLGTNMRFDPDEFNFFRERRNKGATGAFRERSNKFGT